MQQVGSWMAYNTTVSVEKWLEGSYRRVIVLYHMYNQVEILWALDFNQKEKSSKFKIPD
jgi:hypothetical protein